MSLQSWWTERKAFQRTPVDPEGLTRLVHDVVPGGAARVRGRLGGGNETAAHALELVDGTGRVTRAVLKRRPDPRFDGSNEWAALQVAAPASVPTPEPIGFDPRGRWFGRPALVMSRLPGRGDLNVSGEPAALGQMARALAAVHDCDGAGLDETRPRWTRRCPDDASPFERRVWEKIEQRAAGAGPASALVHLDFHPGNVLWYRGRVSGIIDWENGARGWPGEDVAKCRAYLTITHGPAVADEFRSAYEAEIGGPVACLPLSEMAYAIGLQRQAEARAFAFRQSGFPTITADHIRNSLGHIVEEAMRAVE